jgi:hypothetical protein
VGKLAEAKQRALRVPPSQGGMGFYSKLNVMIWGISDMYIPLWGISDMYIPFLIALPDDSSSCVAALISNVKTHLSGNNSVGTRIMSSK